MIGQALRLIRQYHNKSQKQLASSLEISPSYLSEIESNKKSVSVEILQKYSELFSIPVSSIMFFSENLNNTPIKNHIAQKALNILEWVNNIAEKK